MAFSTTLWQAIAPIYEAILAHPFNRELADGSLAAERFRFYIQQDALYLADFARALAILGGRSTTPERTLAFIRFAEGAIVVERALHQAYFQLYGIDRPTTVQAPSCFAYTNFLLATAAIRSDEEGIAALLPCFWIYRQVGAHIYACAAQRGPTAENPYRRWIDTYAGEAFGHVVDQAIAIADQTAEDTTAARREAMQITFITSARLEWMFWDAAYRLERWQP